MPQSVQAAVIPDFLLKTLPPRVPGAAIERARLQRAGDAALDHAAIVLVAPAGFGKTTLLAQWRRRRLAQGVLVAWLRADEHDTPARFAKGVLHALQAARRRIAFEDLRRQIGNDDVQDDAHARDLLSGLLAGIAGFGRATTLVIDDAHRLPDATLRGALHHLLHHAPPNLHVALGTRRPLPMAGWDLVARGECAVLGTEDLRMTLPEATQWLRKRFGQRVSQDDLARLHEATCGWPLGLHLVSATLEGETDLVAAIDSLSGRTGDIARYFRASCAGLPSPIADLLVRTAHLERLCPALCVAVTGDPEAAAWLARACADAPIACASGPNDWVRLHPLARDFLLERFQALPEAERQVLHARAERWFAGRGYAGADSLHRHEDACFHDAAVHAHAGGDWLRARDHARRALPALIAQGRVQDAREWVECLPDPCQRIASWALSIGERNADAFAMAQPLVKSTRFTSSQRIVAARAAFTAAAYGDRAGCLPGLLAAWESILDVDPLDSLARANARATIALHAGQPYLLRRQLAPPTAVLDKRVAGLSLVHRFLLIGLSHLQQGDPLRALAMLAPPLETAERRDGRRSFAASVLAVVVAAALLELDRLQDAEPLLAHRMDLLDRMAPPDVLLLAHRSLCRIALAQGDERRALRALDRLAALADARGLPRLALHALVERIRAHALQERRGIVDGLLDELDAMAPVFEAPDWRPFQPGYRLQRAVAHAHAAIARRDFVVASTHLDTAAACNAPAHPNRESLNVDVLRAVVAHKRREPDALRRLAEARSLGRLGGCHRLLAEAHPLALALDRQLEPDDATAPPPPRRPRRVALRGGLLTAKEAEILAMLDRGMTNKAIARALDISHETVKWHVHNLSLKLEANTRRHAVDRARMLGLLGP